MMAACLLAACSDSGSGSDSSAGVKNEEQIAAEWAAEFASARGSVTTDFEREALADDKITPAEYDEAVQRYMACMKQTLPPEFADGFSASKDEFGMYSYRSPPFSNDEQSARYDQAKDVADEACRLGTIAQIEPLYVRKIMNPNLMTPDQQMIDCLKRHDLVDESYTLGNFLADTAAAFGEDAVPGDYDPGQATGFDLSADEPSQCMVTPWME